MTRFLYMRLSGPMQSWGSNSLFWHRGTEFFPTKSGVLGLLFCAMGKGGPQTEALGEIAGLPQKVLQLGPSEGKHRQVAILTDFHMVGNGYDENDPWQLECVPKLIGGKNRSGGGEKLTKREYLQDASFAVIQEIPDAWSAAVEAGLKVPVWDVYLGRKCCPPALPVFGGISRPRLKPWQRWRPNSPSSTVKALKSFQFGRSRPLMTLPPQSFGTSR